MPAITLTSRRVLALCVLVSVSLIACESVPFKAREKAALGGAALGAGLGAIVGNQVGSTGAGIAIGSAFGAVSGALLGNEIDNTEQALNERQARIDEQDRQIEENRRLINELRGAGLDVRSTERGVVVNLPDVLFEFDSYRLTPSARGTIAEIGKALKGASAGRSISVEGHTDSTGSMEYNQRLSESRARSVASELKYELGEQRRVRVEGYGESRPLASNASSSGRQRNRRVEVVVEN